MLYQYLSGLGGLEYERGVYYSLGAGAEGGGHENPWRSEIRRRIRGEIWQLMRLKGDGAQFQSHFPLPERERDDKNEKQNYGGGKERDGRGDN